MKNPTVVILCTGNSCRSQMAEGLLWSFEDPGHTTGTDEELRRMSVRCGMR